MLSRITAIFISALLFITGCMGTPQLSISSAETSPKPINLSDWHQASIMSGFSGLALVEKDSNTLLKEAYGLADIEAGRAFTFDTVFDTGSVTKQFTAAAILTLQQQGLLSVHDSLQRFFPQVPADKAAITLHQLLTHSSGLLANLSGGDYSVVSRQQFLQRLFASELQSVTGTQFSYSNAGYGLLGLVIEQVSGQSYES